MNQVRDDQGLFVEKATFKLAENARAEQILSLRKFRTTETLVGNPKFVGVEHHPNNQDYPGKHHCIEHQDCIHIAANKQQESDKSLNASSIAPSSNRLPVRLGTKRVLAPLADFYASLVQQPADFASD